MFHFNYDNLPSRRSKQLQKTLKNNSMDNSEMISALSESVADLSTVVEELANSISELSEIMLAGEEEDN